MSLLFLKTVGDTDGDTVGVIVGMKRVGLQLGCDLEYVVGPALRVLVGIANVGDAVGIDDGLRRLPPSVPPDNGSSVGAVVGKFRLFVLLVDTGSLTEKRENVWIYVDLVVGCEDVFEALVGEVEGRAFNGFNVLLKIVGDLEGDGVKIGKTVFHAIEASSLPLSQ